MNRFLQKLTNFKRLSLRLYTVLRDSRRWRNVTLYVLFLAIVIIASTIFFEIYRPEVPQNISRDSNSRLQEFSAIILGAISSILSAMSALFRSDRNGEKSKKRRLKAKYPRLSVVGVFLNRFDNSYVIAKNVTSLTLCAYILLAVLTPVQIKIGVIYFLVAYLVILVAQSYVINYRIKKGYYLNNESEARELIDFVRSNSDDIDFTDKHMKIISKRDLEDIVLTEMNRVPSV